MLSEKLRNIAESSWFQNFITGTILIAAILVGMETYPAVMKSWGNVLHTLDKLILAIFVLEVIIKMGAEGSKPWRYFLDPWNVFDFLIVAACFIPGGGEYMMILRMARLLRVLKLLHAVPRLQILVNALLHSIPSMFYVTLLLSLLFYVYAVAATLLFGPNDPIHFGSLHLSVLSLFRVVTLEDWTDIMYIAMYGCDHYGYGGNEALCVAPQAQPILGAFFFSSFVVIGTMVVLNLFIGVVLKSMDETAAEQEAVLEEARRAKAGIRERELDEELDDLLEQLGDLQTRMDNLRGKMRRRVREQRAAEQRAAGQPGEGAANAQQTDGTVDTPAKMRSPEEE